MELLAFFSWSVNQTCLEDLGRRRRMNRRPGPLRRFAGWDLTRATPRLLDIYLRWRVARPITRRDPCGTPLFLPAGRVSRSRLIYGPQKEVGADVAGIQREPGWCF